MNSKKQRSCCMQANQLGPINRKALRNYYDSGIYDSLCSIFFTGRDWYCNKENMNKGKTK